MELKGTLQSKKGYLYAVIGYKDEAGKQKYKWYATGLKERGNKKEAKEMVIDVIKNTYLLKKEKRVHSNS